MPEATNRKRPADPEPEAEDAHQQAAKRPKRRGKGRKNYAALENGDGASSGEGEGEGDGVHQGGSGDGATMRLRLAAQREKEDRSDVPQQLSRKDTAAQMTLSEDRRSVTARLGYRTVRSSALRLPALAAKATMKSPDEARFLVAGAVISVTCLALSTKKYGAHKAASALL